MPIKRVLIIKAWYEYLRIDGAPSNYFSDHTIYREKVVVRRITEAAID